MTWPLIQPRGPRNMPNSTPIMKERAAERKAIPADVRAGCSWLAAIVSLKYDDANNITFSAARRLAKMAFVDLISLRLLALAPLVAELGLAYLSECRSR